MRISDQSLHGKHVISADGNIIGTVNAVYIDAANLRVDALAVAVRKEFADALGVAHGVFHKGVVEVPASEIQSVGETIVLSVPTADLRTARRQAAETPAPPRTTGETPATPHHIGATPDRPQPVGR